MDKVEASTPKPQNDEGKSGLLCCKGFKFYASSVVKTYSNTGGLEVWHVLLEPLLFTMSRSRGYFEVCAKSWPRFPPYRQLSHPPPDTGKISAGVRHRI